MFFFWQADGISNTTDTLTFVADPSPSERALERAEVVRHWDEAKCGKCQIKFQPKDSIFSQSDGCVDDSQTHESFVGAMV